MKRRNYLYAAGFILAAAFASCTEDENVLGLQNGQVEVTVEKDVLSRTTLAEDNETVYWCATDQIYLFDSDGTSKGVLNLKEGAGETTATFSGKVTGQLNKIDKALYPVPTVKGGKYSYDFPAERNWTDNSAAPMVGELENKHVAFRNLAAMVRIDLQGYTYDENSELVLTMYGQKISGTAVVDMTDETLAIFEGGNSLTVTGIGSNVRFIDLPVPAGEYTNYVVTLNGVELAKSEESKVLTKDNVAILGQTKSELTPNENGEYEIRTAADMFWLAEQVNTGNSFKGETVKLMNDIDMSLKDWTPIGMVPVGGSTNNFGGTFDGNNHTLSGLKVEGGDAALFGRTSGATIKNLTIDNSEFIGTNWAGCLVAYVSYSLTLENVKATNSIAVEKGNTYENRLIGSGSKERRITINGNQLANTFAELQTLVNGEDNEIKVILGCDIKGDLTVTQKSGVKVTIDGDGHAFDGVITVDGKSATYTTAGVSIMNMNFNAESISVDACINLGVDGDNNTRYTCNVTVEGCTFDVPDAVGVKSYTGGDKNLSVVGCTATEKTHSLVQAKGIDGILVEKCFVYSKNGLNFNNSTNVTVNYCTTDVKGYAVRFGESSGGAGAAEKYTIKNSALKSACNDGDAVIILRGTADNSTLSIENTTLEGTIEITNEATNATVVIDGAVQKKASDQNGLNNAVSSGDDVIVTLSDGEYTIPTNLKAGQEVKIIGNKDTEINITNGIVYPSSNDVTMHFDGVTINGSGYTNGLANTTATYTNCTFNTADMYLYRSAKFIGCTFNDCGTYALWTWGAGTVEFEGFTFNSTGKALYVNANVLDNGTNHQTVKITDCKFYDTGDNNIQKAAIETGDDYNRLSYDIFISNITVEGFSVTEDKTSDFNYGGTNFGTNVWGNKYLMGTDKLNVVIDGQEVY